MPTEKPIIILPDALPYPKIFPFNELPEIKNKFCYVLDWYPQDGIALVIARGDGYACIRMADFVGKIIDLATTPSYKPLADEIMKEYCTKLDTFLQYARVPKAIFYFSNDGNARLVDMRLSINKFCGPGYLQDFIGRLKIPIQKTVIDPRILDDEALKILNGKDYVGKKFILKPSAFKFIIRDGETTPLYGVLTNEAKSDT